jgi:hypothetical protein
LEEVNSNKNIYAPVKKQKSGSGRFFTEIYDFLTNEKTDPQVVGRWNVTEHNFKRLDLFAGLKMSFGWT